MHSTCSLLIVLLACLNTSLATNIMGGEGIGGVMWFVRDIALGHAKQHSNIFGANIIIIIFLILSR